VTEVEKRLRELATYRETADATIPYGTAAITEGAADEITRLRADLAEAVKALEPLAAMIGDWPEAPDDERVYQHETATYGDLRRAREIWEKHHAAG
jgi:hypothetical protein